MRSQDSIVTPCPPGPTLSSIFLQTLIANHSQATKKTLLHKSLTAGWHVGGRGLNVLLWSFPISWGLRACEGGGALRACGGALRACGGSRSNVLLWSFHISWSKVHAVTSQHVIKVSGMWTDILRHIIRVYDLDFAVTFQHMIRIQAH